VLEFDARDPDGAVATLAGFGLESACWPWVLTELAMGAGRGRHVPDPDLFEASIRRQGDIGVIPAALAALAGDGIPDTERRIGLLSSMFDISPTHLPVFASLRRELLAAGRVEQYGAVLEKLCENAGGSINERLEGERIALLCLSEGSSLGEQELRDRLERSQGDTFLPLFLAGLGAYPALSAEAAEKLASGLEGAQADRWWFEAARIWLGVDVQKATSALDRIEDPEWRIVADALREAAAWGSMRWDEVAGQLLFAMKQIPEGEISERILSRMVYVDGILKGEVSMAMAEAESLLDTKGSATLFCVRFLMTRLLAQGRLNEATRSFEVLARSLVGSDESTAYAWLANRVLETDDSTRPRADVLVRDVLEARAADLPLLLLADAQARRCSDLDMLRSVVSEMAGTLENPREQGALLWVLALLFADHDQERALSAAREAHDRLNNNPASALLVEQLARAREEWATAAMFARQAGSLTRESMFGIEDLLRAGETYRDRLREGGWAVQCFEQAMNLDSSDPRAFNALREHFTSLGDWDHVASLIEERILVIEGPGSRHELLRDLAYVYEQAGRVEEAIASLRRILTDEPEDPSSLESLGNLCVRTRKWEEAVSVLQERAMLPMEPALRAEVFTTLGGLYVDQVPDDKRAIVCFEKVIEEGLSDLDVVQQLARLYEKTGAWEKGLKMAEVMFNAAEDEEQKAGWLVAAGRLWHHGAGDTRRAEQSYEMARKQLPAAFEPIVALVELYRSQGDQRALSFHLERSMGDLRHFMQDDPADLQHYHTVFEIARATDDPLAIRVAGTLLASLYDLNPDEQVKFDATGGPLTWSPSGWLATEGVDEVISPDSFTPSFKVLTTRLGDTLLKSVDYDPKRFGISRTTRLQKRQGADVKMVDEIARWFGVKPLTVHLTDLIPSVLTVLPDNPPLLVIGEPLYRTLDDAQKRFAFAWGCKLVASGLVPFMSLGEAGLPSLWVALMQQFEPSYFISGVDPGETVTLAAALRKNFPKKAREELFGAGLECTGDQRIDVSRLYSDISTYADGAALMACGDISSALQFAWLVSSGEEPFNSDYTAARALADSRSLARLVEFVISGRFARGLMLGE
jgi:tetratricopeptide (TPR) repeat protein